MRSQRLTGAISNATFDAAAAAAASASAAAVDTTAAVRIIFVIF